MKKIVIEVPRYLNYKSTYEFVCKLQELEDNFCYIFCFKNTRRVEPFGMLFFE